MKKLLWGVAALVLCGLGWLAHRRAQFRAPSVPPPASTTTGPMRQGDPGRPQDHLREAHPSPDPAAGPDPRSPADAVSHPDSKAGPDAPAAGGVKKDLKEDYGTDRPH